MTKKNQDPTEFASLFKDAKPVLHNKYVPSREELAKNKASRLANKMAFDTNKLSQKERKQQQASLALSDGFEAHWPEDKPIKFLRSILTSSATSNTESSIAVSKLSQHDEQHMRKDLLKQVQRGNIPPDIEVDLHGLNSHQAKEELIAVIFEAKKRHYACINIIHGHGNGVLKHKVPNWLVQHPDVAGFIQAPKAYGGKAGLLVLVGADFNALK